MRTSADVPPSGADRASGPHPGGSQVPQGDDLAAERARYERHGGDHVARYRWAAAHLRDARVLDVGCGHGFGALLLAGSYRSYLGVDVDPPAIEWARRVVAPRAPGGQFELGPGFPMAGTFDAVTCFEVLEHVDDPADLLRDLARAVAPGGTIFLSTPNGSLSDGRPEWFMSPYHVAEYTAPQFAALVRASLPAAGEFFAQRRFDRLDCLPQAIRRQLTGSDLRAPSGRSVGAIPTPTPLRIGHSLFRQIPSPASVWRLDPLGIPAVDGLGYSHLVWAGRSPGP